MSGFEFGGRYLMNPMTDDGQLLRQYIETRSEAAFAELVQRHLSLVYFAALRRLGGDAHAAADVSQGVFILLARKAPSLCRHPTLAGWLYSAVNLEVSSLHRAARRRQAREQAAGVLLESEAQADPIFDGEFLRPILDEAIMDLGAPDREAVLLRFFQGCPFAELGKKLGVSEAAAQKRVDRALEKLRHLLEKRQVTSTSAALVLALASQSALAAPPALAAAIPGAAIAAAGTGGLGLVGILNLMSTTKLTTGVAGFVAIAALLGTSAIGVGIYQLRQSGQAESALRAGEADLGTREESLRGSQRQLAAADQSLAALRRSLANAPAGGAAGNPRQQAAASRFLALHPEARAMLGQVSRAQIAGRYDPFFKSVGMSQAEIDKFLDAVNETVLNHLVLTPLTITPSVVMPPEADLRTLLGDERYQQFQDFNQVLPAFAFANQAGIAAGLAGEPLSSSQKDQLVQVLVKNSPAYEANGPMTMPQVNWDAVMPQAQALVSPTQWRALQASFLRMQLSQALIKASQEAQGGSSQKN
jgi:RNA polymerase sigma factor (sigma-70 family)